MTLETEHLIVRKKKPFLTIASDSREYLQSIIPTNEFFEELRRRRVDIFTFVERRWCCPLSQPSKSWSGAKDNIAILHVKSYDEWWKAIGKKTRNMIRKAEKSNIRTHITEPNENLADGIWKIYNETPIRQDRAFPHYGLTLQAVKEGVVVGEDKTYIGADLDDELVGFIQLIGGDRIVIISQILSLQRHADKAVNNALLAKAVEVCSLNNWQWLMYGRIGNHPSLDRFKKSNGFDKFPITRYYVPVTRMGQIAISMKLHRDIKDILPDQVKLSLIPLYNWVSRTKARLRFPTKEETRIS